MTPHRSAAYRSGAPTGSLIIRAVQLLAVALVGVTAFGCESAARASRDAWRGAYVARPGGYVPNFLLGKNRETNLIAEEFAERSDWPSVDGGYEFDRVTFFNEVIYDDQSFYDRFSGGYSRQSETVRSGVVVR